MQASLRPLEGAATEGDQAPVIVLTSLQTGIASIFPGRRAGRYIVPFIPRGDAGNELGASPCAATQEATP